jgi:hypothetical protein
MCIHVKQAGAVAAPPRVDTKAGRGRVVWCARTGALWCWFGAHSSSISIIRIGTYNVSNGFHCQRSK